MWLRYNHIAQNECTKGILPSLSLVDKCKIIVAEHIKDEKKQHWAWSNARKP